MNSDIWFLLSSEQVALARERAPQMTRVVGVSSTALPPVESLKEQGYEIVNVDTGIRTADIRAYRSEGLGVNVYTIDEPWLFSQFWLSGVTSVTTNNVHNFNQLDRPVINISYDRYMLFWGLFGIVLAIWLASSQPEPEPVPVEELEPIDLMDLDFGPDVQVEIPKRAVPLNGEQPAPDLEQEENTPDEKTQDSQTEMDTNEEA
jgi:hypothetical protein